MLTATQKRKILKQVFSKTDKTIESPRVFICFAGIPASGKSTLSKKIQKKFGGTISTGDKVVDKFFDSDEINKDPQGRMVLLFSLMQKAIEDQVFGKNQLLILDSSLDRVYPKIKQYADSVGYSMYLISIDIPEEEILSRLEKRNPGKALQFFLKGLPGWKEDHKQFLSKVKPNFSYSNDSQLDELLDDLKEFLESKAVVK